MGRGRFRVWPLFLVLVNPLLGCASPQWTQNGKPQQVDYDNVACMQEIAPLMRASFQAAYVLPQGRVFNSCMETKGYTLARNE